MKRRKGNKAARKIERAWRIAKEITSEVPEPRRGRGRPPQDPAKKLHAVTIRLTASALEKYSKLGMRRGLSIAQVLRDVLEGGGS